ncbi:MAG: hypothetical protein ACRECR_01520, partial [Thermoplasmata archaeon]
MLLGVAFLLLIPTGLSVASTVSPTASTSVTIPGNLDISTAVSYSNTALTVLGGVQIASGGSLHLKNVTLHLLEPMGLDNGIVILSGGNLTATGLTVESSTSGNPWWLRANSGSHLSIDGGDLVGLGAASRAGIVLESSGANLTGITFSQYY